jgi:diadenosine tetraphosphate (Ap4A) HIT family hydrolase
MSEFVLHSRLEADTTFVADWSLSCVLAMNDTRYPWLVLVPRRAELTELHDLSVADRAVLMEEIARAGAALKSLSGAAKINVGALGNIVPQLHIHVVVRTEADAAWPGAVWGHGRPVPYEAAARDSLIARLKASL